MLPNQLAPLPLQVYFILCDYREFGGVMHAVSEKEQAIEFMALLDKRLGKTKRSSCRLGGVGRGIDDNRKFHSSSLIQAGGYD